MGEKYQSMMIQQSEIDSQDSYHQACSQIDYSSVYEKSNNTQSAYRSRQVSYQHNQSTKDLYAIWEQNMGQQKQQKRQSTVSNSIFSETK